MNCQAAFKTQFLSYGSIPKELSCKMNQFQQKEYKVYALEVISFNHQFLLRLNKNHSCEYRQMASSFLSLCVGVKKKIL